MNTTHYLSSDHLGSSNAITDASGANPVTESYSPFGSIENLSGGSMATVAGISRQGFTGQENLDNLGKVNMNGRVYTPSAGVFMSADPFVSDLYNPQNLNRKKHSCRRS